MASEAAKPVNRSGAKSAALLAFREAWPGGGDSLSRKQWRSGRDSNCRYETPPLLTVGVGEQHGNRAVQFGQREEALVCAYGPGSSARPRARRPPWPYRADG